MLGNNKNYPTRRRAAIPPPRFLGGFEATEKILKNQLKIDQQINEHRSNIDQKSSKKPPKNGRKSGQDGSKRRSCWLLAAMRPQHAPQDVPRHSQEGLLEASWGPGGRLGRKKLPKMAPSWRPKRRQNPSWGVLEASWELLGGVM